MKSKLLLYFVIAAVVVAAVPALSQLLWHARLFAGRAPFPLDLEWMEGGMLIQSRRFIHGQGIYVQPSLDFIPFLYTPLYQGLVGLLSLVFPLGYLLGRLVSILAFSASLFVIGRLAMGQGQSRGQKATGVVVGLIGAAVVAASFAFTGAFYDLVRSDSLLLCFEAFTLWLCYRGEGWKSAAAAGLLIALGFFTKQTASILGLGLGVGLLLVRFRRGVVYGLVAAAVLVAGILLLVKTSDGWFWTYIFKLHQSHPFRKDAAFQWAPKLTLQHLWPVFAALGISTMGLALGRRLRRPDILLWSAAVAGEVSAIVGFGTMWAFANAYIPAVFFAALAAAVLSARLVAASIETKKWGTSLFATAAVLSLGYQSLRIDKPKRADAVPSAQDRVSADRLLTVLKDLPGPLFIPFHTYYGVLAGKQPYAHRMGVRDVEGVLGRPKGLDEALATQSFQSIVLDWKSQPGEWPFVEAKYHVVREFREGTDSVRMFAGAQTSPRQLWIPNASPPPRSPDAILLFDFERGDYLGFTATGTAMGPAPAPAPRGMFGRFVVDSTRFGIAATGTLRSTPFPIDKPKLQFYASGPRDPAIHVRLFADGVEVKSYSPSGALEKVEWDVMGIEGKAGEFQIEDSSATGGIILDEVILY